jgi:hypothetical protein
MTEATATLVASLDRLQQSPGTLALFDALSVDDAAGVARALAAHPRHPLRAEVEAWLVARGVAVPPPPSPADICAERGIDDLAGHLDRLDRQLVVQSRGVEATRERAERAESLANAYAAVLVVVGAIALLGWASALDYLAIVDPPAPPPRAASPSPTAPAAPER